MNGLEEKDGLIEYEATVSFSTALAFSLHCPVPDGPFLPDTLVGDLSWADGRMSVLSEDLAFLSGLLRFPCPLPWLGRGKELPPPGASHVAGFLDCRSAG